ncbi:acetyl-CoA synthase subunit gamma, partial [bacterium]|nr:acetyl-CoA synthase subunit gamma [bacterium]
VRFPLRDRAVLIPVELVASAKYALLITVCLLLLAGVSGGGYSFSLAAAIGFRCAMLFLAAYLSGVILTPILLPWLPGRSFSAKGMWIGLGLALVIGVYVRVHPTVFENLATAAAWFLIIPAVTSFMAMNFTGASTYTSLSGVRREMRVAVPIQVASAVVGVGLWLAGRFV